MLNCYWIFQGVKHVRVKLHNWGAPHKLRHIYAPLRHHIHLSRTHHRKRSALYKWVCTTGFAGAGAGGLGYAWWPSIANWYWGGGYAGYGGTGVIPSSYAATPVPEPNSLFIFIVFIALFAVVRLAKKA